MMGWLRQEWAQIFILACPFIVLAVLWPSIPDQVPIHWNVHGEADDFAGKWFGTLLVPVTNVATTLLIMGVFYLDPKLKKASPEARQSSAGFYQTVRLLLSSFLSVLSILMLLIAVGVPLNLSLVINLCTLGLLLVLGNIMGKIAPNYFAGIRTPWTLESPTVWRQTHRVGGWWMVAYALVGLILLPILPEPYYTFGYFMPFLILLVAGTTIYSWWLYQQEKTEAGNST